jgi:predicted kinase
MRPVLVVLVGPPASGKSTLAERLAVRLPATVVQSDAIRKALVTVPRYTPEEHQQVFAAAHTETARLLRAGSHVVFDATNLEDDPRRVLAGIAAECAAELLIARLAISRAEAQRRLERRGTARAAGDLSDADWVVYQMLATRFEPIQGPHWVLNGTSAPDALAALLARQIRARQTPAAAMVGTQLLRGED